MESSVSIHGVSKVFGKHKALENVTFEIPKNTAFGLLGPNGAGKTTLFSLCAGFLKPTAGNIKVLGIDVEQVSELRGRLSILPQDALFQANVPVLEQLVFFCELMGYSPADALAEAMRALEAVGLVEQATRNARVLSHGMNKRMGIAQAFLGHPEVIFLDEPTAGLDPVNAKGIRDIIKKLKTSATLIISSHDLGEIQEMCSHVAILDKGNLVECSSVAHIVGAAKKVRMSFARKLTGAEVAAIQSVAGVTEVGQHGSLDENHYVVNLDLDRAQRKQEEVVGEIVQKLVMTGAIPRSITDGDSLENRFLEVTGGKA